MVGRKRILSFACGMAFVLAGFPVQSDERVPVSNIPLAGRVHDAEAPPELHIHMKVADIYARKKLSVAQRLCFEEKGIPSVPPEMLTPEKEYEDAGKEEYDEYFSGDRYAKYKTWNDYNVDLDTCQITKKHREEASIDDGRFAYKLDLVKRTGGKSVSGAVDKPRSQERLQKFTKEHPEVAVALGNIMVPPGQAESMKQSLKKALTPVATETYAGQSCDVITLGSKNHKLCRWTKMHEYPSVMKRPIDLMFDVPLPAWLDVPAGAVRGEASEFEIGKKIAGDKFKPPVGIVPK